MANSHLGLGVVPSDFYENMDDEQGNSEGSWGRSSDEFRKFINRDIDDIQITDFEEEQNFEQSYFDRMDESQTKPVRDYLDAIKRWQDPELNDNAFKLDTIRLDRQELAKEISENGLLAHKDLLSVSPYLGADFAEIEQTDSRESEYARIVTERAIMRDTIFGEATEIDADIYAKAVAEVKGEIRSGGRAADEYILLDIRREVVQEHFDDPVFIANIGLAADNNLRDELLFDLDRMDLDVRENKSRSDVSSDLFISKINDRFGREKDAPTSSKIFAFKELQGMSSELISDPSAIMTFARQTNGLEKGSVLNMGAYKVGLQALQQTECDAKALEDFFGSIPKEERSKVIAETVRDPAKLFSYARKKFEHDFANPMDPSANVGVSFAVMESAGQTVLRMGSKNVSKMFDGPEGLEDAEALMQFQGDNLKVAHKAGSDIMTKGLYEGLENRGLLREERESFQEGLGIDAPIVKGLDGKDIEFSISRHDTPEIEVMDGGHVAIRIKKEGFSKTAAAGVVSGKLNLDLESNEGMAAFLADDGHLVAEKFKAAAIGQSDLEGSGIQLEEMAKFSDGSTSKSARSELAFKLGLGESVLKSVGMSAEDFSKLSSGEVTVHSFQRKIDNLGLSEDRLKSLGINREALNKISKLKSGEEGLVAYQNIIEKSAAFRLEGMIAPPDGMMTADGKLDAGIEAKAHLQQIISKNRSDGKDALNFEFGKSADGKENTVSVNLRDGRYLSDVMLQDGYALPLDGEARNRKEKFAQRAETKKKGLWANGMPEEDDTWRRDIKSPALTAHDKKEMLFKSVGASMPGSAAGARRQLGDRKVQIFALPLKQWANEPNVLREVSAVTKSNPKKIKKIYAQNMEILTDLRERNKKGTLTEDEKLAHDRLSVGRRVLAESLVENKHMTKEEAMKDSHKLLSRKAMFSDGFREKLVKASEKTMDIAGEGVKKAGKGAMNVTKSAMDFALDP